MELKIELKVDLTDEDIDDIMVSALEGGICYWCNRAEVNGDYLGTYASDQISRGGTLKLHLDEPVNDTEVFVLDKEKFIEGVKKHIAFGDFGCVERVVGDYGLYTGTLKIDAGAIDAVAADMIVQYAVFDEVVFG